MKFTGKSRLWKDLMKNYLLLFLIMVVIGILSIVSIVPIVSLYYKDSQPKLIASEIIMNNYKHMNTSDVIKNNGWVEVLDNNYNVIFVSGNKKTNTLKYTKEQIYDMAFSNYNGNFFYSFAYNKPKKFIVLVAYPENMVDIKLNFNGKSSYAKPLISFMAIGFLFFILGLILSIYFYSKLTSKKFVTPINELSKGAKAISSGNYGKQVEINLKSNNEISELKDAFNFMSIKLKAEIELKNKIDENRKQLVLDMAHDLKNPITSALGYSELLLSKNISAEEVIRYSKIIFNNCKRANMLAVSLFEFSHLQSDGFNLNLIEEDICEFVRKLIADYLPKIEDKGLLYDFSIPESEILLKFDKNNLYRAISNILDNCIKYNKSGTQINLNLTQIDTSITILIEDNGCGISKEILPTILDPFVRVDKARNSETGGTGLGLSIADMIIKKHGGTLEVQSDINKGCKFILELPIA